MPVTAMKGTESRKALASEIGKLAEPGPHEVKVAVGWPDTRYYTSAMKPATLSWRTETVLMSFLRSYKASMNWILP